jgi:hypothetical protein
MMWSKHSRRIDPISRSVLPRRSWRSGLVPDAHGAQSAFDDAAIDPFAIAEEVVRSLPGKCPRYLTCNPFGGGICCDVDPDEVSSVEPDNEEGIEPVEIESWNNEQIHDGNVRRVITQEVSPSLAGRRPSFHHVLGNARLLDLEPSLQSKCPNSRCGSQMTELRRRLRNILMVLVWPFGSLARSASAPHNGAVPC